MWATLFTNHSQNMFFIPPTVDQQEVFYSCSTGQCFHQVAPHQCYLYVDGPNPCEYSLEKSQMVPGESKRCPLKPPLQLHRTTKILIGVVQRTQQGAKSSGRHRASCSRSPVRLFKCAMSPVFPPPCILCGYYGNLACNL